MSGPLLFMSGAAEVERHGALFIVTLTSGATKHGFAVTRASLRSLIEAARRRMSKAEKETAGVLVFDGQVGGQA